MDFEVIHDSLPLYAGGLAVTLQLLLISLATGLVVALPLAMLRVAPSRVLHGPVWLFTYAIRGTPLLVQLFLVYYGLAQFDAVRASFAWPWLQSAAFCACLAFGINTCAYTTEILAGALRATPAGEVEAARAMGLSRPQVWRRILWPSALRRAIPAYGNEIVLMLHGTSLASVVTLVDLTGAAREVNSRHYLPFEAFVTAGAIYLGITLALVAALHAAERRWLAHLRPRIA
ncbi:MAG TPA: ABC transporter permease [Methylibium sp.]|uniref:ABC transporter permease n=1 Tax=Methylibium sp. TaxID=2067992 RepID=UPI002DB8F7D4|nr:ABC transporter permease [Methylibium sp.]HEU4457611.1 ABC transporter permease [Methylibium sp.]